MRTLAALATGFLIGAWQLYPLHPILFFSHSHRCLAQTEPAPVRGVVPSFTEPRFASDVSGSEETRLTVTMVA